MTRISKRTAKRNKNGVFSRMGKKKSRRPSGLLSAPLTHPIIRLLLRKYLDLLKERGLARRCREVSADLMKTTTGQTNKIFIPPRWTDLWKIRRGNDAPLLGDVKIEWKEREKREKKREEGTKTIRTDEERYYSNGKRHNFRGKRKKCKGETVWWIMKPRLKKHQRLCMKSFPKIGELKRSEKIKYHRIQLCFRFVLLLCRLSNV